MNMFVRVILALVLLISATVEAADGGVSIRFDKVTLTCPEEGEWFKGNTKVYNESTAYEYEYTGGKDNYYCKYTLESNEVKHYYFYIQGKTCPNCIELDALLFAGVIVGDVILTAVFMVIVYKCTKKKAPGGPQHGMNSSRSREPDIDLTPSHYAPLSPNTRSDEYSVINRTG